MTNYSITILFVFFTLWGRTQDSTSRHSISFNAGIGKSNAKLLSDHEWYTASNSFDFNILLSRKLKKNNYIVSGINYSRIKYQSDTFVNLIPIGFNPSSGDIIYTTDGIKRVRIAKVKKIGLPILYEYMSSKTLSPYFRVGFLANFTFSTSSQDYDTETGKPIYSYSYSSSNIVYPRAFFSVDGIINGGIKYRHKNTDLLLGMMYTSNLFDFDQNTQLRYYNLQFQLGLRHEIPTNKFPHKESFRKLPIREPLQNSIYLEILGNGGFYSLNYERSILRFSKNSINLRAGFSIVPSLGSGGYLTMPIGVNWNYGNARKFELGMGVTPYYDFYKFGDYNSYFSALLAPSIGYRREYASNKFLRYAFTPLIEPNVGVIAIGGITFGKNF